MFSYRHVIILLTFTSVESRVCKTIDVRNTPERIWEYRNCTVIDGNLSVVLMETVEDEDDYLSNNFMDLHEVTGFVMLYRLINLTSLDVLFPKLTNIGGEGLFFNYSLVLYDLFNLTEIGLRNLKKIGAGSVKIGGQYPNLCYVDTVDWQALGVSYVTYQKPKTCNCCQRCSLDCRGFCWNEFQCQTKRDAACHDLCIGCTKPNSPLHCVECKFYDDDGTCVRSCQKNKLNDDISGRCITPQECLSKLHPWSIFKTSCISRCPPWWERHPSTGKCVQSNRNICDGFAIRSVSELKAFEGCTYINGSLDIQLNDPLHDQILERYFANVTTISGFLKISRSLTFTSLKFFQQLEHILGESLWSKYYSLFIVDNPNLQESFLNNSRINIKNGEVLFQGNPYLCGGEISGFNVKRTNVANGYAMGARCSKDNNTEFKLKVTYVNESTVEITWDFNSGTNKTFYTVFYAVISTEMNLGKFYDCEAEDYNWHSVLVTSNSVALQDLYPYTRYRYYVEAHFDKNISSSISTFETLRSTELITISEITAESINDTAIELSWSTQDPRHSFELSHFHLSVYLQPDYSSIKFQRNYCRNPYKKQVVPQTCTSSEEMICKKITYYEHNFQLGNKRSVPDLINEFNISVHLSNFVVDQLKPFTVYIFYLQGCNDDCGGAIFAMQRTQKRTGIDVVTNIAIEVKYYSIEVTWEDPVVSNSIILAFKIEYQSPHQSKLECITSRQFEKNNRKHNIFNLAEGAYKIRVVTLTLAGYADSSQWVYFVVSSFNWFLWLATLAILFLLLLLAFLIWQWSCRTKRDDQETLIENEVLVEDDVSPFDDETLRIVRDLGEDFLITYRP